MTNEKSYCPKLPLYTQVLIGVACGAVLGVTFGQEAYWGGLTNQQLGRLGMLLVQLLKTLAIPLIFPRTRPQAGNR